MVIRPASRFFGSSALPLQVNASAPDGRPCRRIPGARGSPLAWLDGYTVSVYRNVVIRSFADPTTADLWAERNSKAARRIPRELWHTVYRKLTMLDSAQRLGDLAAAPGNRFEALAGDRKGQHSIRVNQQYRLTFRWESNDAYDVRCEDYH